VKKIGRWKYEDTRLTIR